MIKVYHLSTCSTCKKIINSIRFPDKTEFIDIKFNPITETQIDEMHSLSGSFEALFSKRAIKYKSLELKEKNLSESDFKKYIMSEYTFLKRPVIIYDASIYIGNSAKNIDAFKKALNES